MSKEIWTQINPKIKKAFFELRDHILDILKKYKSLANYGYSYLRNERDIAVIWYIYKNYATYNEIAKELNVNPSSIYRLIKKIQNNKPIQVFDGKEVKTVRVNEPELWNIVQEMLNEKSKRQIKDIMDSEIIRKFVENPEKIQKSRKRQKYSKSQVSETLKYVREIVMYIKTNKKDIPSNPDLWEEDKIREVIHEMYGNISKIRQCKKALHRIKQFREWFKGEIGAEASHIAKQKSFREIALFNKDVIRIKKIYEEGKLSLSEFLIPTLHWEGGCREGWESQLTKETAEKYGTNADNLDLDYCETSLIGLNWKNVVWKQGKIEKIKIWEEKTEKWWELKDWYWKGWLFELLEKIYKRFRRKEGSIIKDILRYDGIMINTVGEFRKWYIKTLRKIIKLLGYDYDFKPHDMRRTHISVLAELGVPLELAVSDKLPLGVGWDDLKTAVLFYLRFSKHTWERVLRIVESGKKEFM